MTGERGGPAERAVDGMAYAEPGDLVAVRTFVRSAAVDRGLPSSRAEMMVLAVSELATNTLQHTTGGGRVRVWGNDRQVVCEVVDGGGPRSFGRMPHADSHRGRGLAIVEQIVDGVSSYAGPDGTVVQIRIDR